MTKEEREVIQQAIKLLSKLLKEEPEDRPKKGGSSECDFVGMLVNAGLVGERFTTTQVMQKLSVTEEFMEQFEDLIYLSGSLAIRLGRLLSKVATLDTGRSGFLLKRGTTDGVSVYRLVRVI